MFKLGYSVKLLLSFSFLVCTPYLIGLTLNAVQDVTKQDSDIVFLVPCHFHS
jgi:hypothetical protein